MFTINNKTKLACLALLLAYFIITVQPWNLYFLNDDFVHIPLSTKSILVHFQFFRPVPNLLTALEVQLFGNNAVGFHLTSMILHIMATVCVGILCHHLIRKYSDEKKYSNAGYVAAVLFFVYPFHTEPVMWIIGRIGTIATIFILLSLIFFLKRSHRSYFYYLSLLSFTMALFTYETSWVTPLFISLLVAVDYVKTKKDGKKQAMYALPYWVLFGMFMATRFSLLPEIVSDYEFSGHTISPGALVANFFRLLARTLVPQAISTTQFIITFLVAATILVGYLLFLMKMKSFRSLHWLLILFLIISFFPTTQIGIDTHGSEGERYIYLSSGFWIILLTTLLYELPLKIGKLVLLIVIIIYSVLFARSASNYRHASFVAKKLLSLVGTYTGNGKIIAINLPANYKGALIFRSGFSEAISWIYPEARKDSIIIIPAQRTYNKIGPIDIIHINGLDRIDAKKVTVDNKVYTLYYESDTIQLNSSKDMLIYFNKAGQGMILYPEPD